MTILKTIFDLLNTFENNFNQIITPLFIGPSGIGKTTIILNYLSDNKISYYKIDASLLSKDNYNEFKNDLINKFLKVKYVVINNFNTTPIDILKKLLDIILEKRFENKKINTKFICIANDIIPFIIDNENLKTKFLFINFIDLLKYENKTVFSYVNDIFKKYSNIINNIDFKYNKFEITPTVNSRTILFTLHTIEQLDCIDCIKTILNLFFPINLIERFFYAKNLDKNFLLKNLNNNGLVDDFINILNNNPLMLKTFANDEIVKIIDKLKENNKIDNIKNLYILGG